MSCPDEGLLRALLDGEAHEADVLGEHLAQCPACRSRLEDLRQSAAVATAAIGALGPEALPTPLATALARERLRTRQRAGVAHPGISAVYGEESVTTAHSSAPTSRQGTHSNRERPMAIVSDVFARWRLALAGMAAALMLAFFVGTPTGQTTAAAFLSQFRSERFTVISFDPDSSRNRAFMSLEELGTVVSPRHQPEHVTSVQEAERRLRMTIAQPQARTLPAGVRPEPEIEVIQPSEVRFTFDKAKADRHFREIGEDGASLPANLDGTTLVISLPGAVMMTYRGDQDMPGVMYGQSTGLLEADTQGGATLEEVRAFLLDMPGLDVQTRRQLEAIQDWRNTLPIPVPADQISWKDTSVNSSPGLVFNDNSGLGSAVLWQADGRVFGIAGPLKATEIQQMAEGVQ